MPGDPALVVFYGGAGSTAIEETLDRARLASALDTLEKARIAGIGRLILVTDDPSLDADVAGVEIDVWSGPYHFGRRLVDVIRRHRLSAVIYAGAGSMPLYEPVDLAEIAEMVASGIGVTNNIFSSDLIAFSVTEEALSVVEGIGRDNSLARALSDAGMEMAPMQRTVGTQFDIDSPGDLAVLALTGHGGPRLRSYLAEFRPDTSRLEALVALFTDRNAQVLVAGRVGSHAWSQLERESMCRVRLVVEERGMLADNRAELGTARSLLAMYLDAVGMDAFFAALPELGDGALIDTRVLMAHKRVTASREDRFLSDVGEWEAIADAFLREFTRKAAEASIPVVLGGHSMLSGGLMALNDHAWRVREGVPGSL